MDGHVVLVPWQVEQRVLQLAVPVDPTVALQGFAYLFIWNCVVLPRLENVAWLKAEAVTLTAPAQVKSGAVIVVMAFPVMVT